MSQLNLDQMPEMDPLPKIINEESEYSQSGSDPDNSVQRRKRRYLKKHRGGNIKDKKSKKSRSKSKHPDQHPEAILDQLKEPTPQRAHQPRSPVTAKAPKAPDARSEKGSSHHSYGSSSSSDLDYGDEHSGSDDYASSTSSRDSLAWHDDPEAENYEHQNMIPMAHSQIAGQTNQTNNGERASHLMPIKFAKEHIIKIEEDMKKMHERHVRLMREMDENYKLIEQETQEYYIEFLQKWKEIAKQKISQYRANIEQIAKEKDRVTQERDNTGEMLRLEKLNLQQILKDHNQQLLQRDQEYDKYKQE